MIMKKESILAIAFLIGTSGLFATDFEKQNHNNHKNPIETPSLDATENSDNLEITTQNYKHTSYKNKKLQNLNHNNIDLFYKDIQLEAAKNYINIMPDIVGKE